MFRHLKQFQRFFHRIQEIEIPKKVYKIAKKKL